MFRKEFIHHLTSVMRQNRLDLEVNHEHVRTQADQDK